MADSIKRIFKDKADFVSKYREACESSFSKKFEDMSDQERYYVLGSLIANKTRNLDAGQERDGREVYYFSLEFLLGPLLDNYLLNLGIRDIVKEGCAELGISLDTMVEQEADPGLGNGGLGRLAACFLDSMAALGINGNGNGMRYRYGLFRQEIEGGRQVEKMDNWLEHGFPWETRKNESAVVVQFGGHVVRHEENGRFWFTQEGGDLVKAVPYDVPIVGYGGKTVNNLRLWSAEPAEEDFDLDAFNAGDYAKAMKFRSDVEAISQILYPNDSGEHGRILRRIGAHHVVYPEFDAGQRAAHLVSGRMLDYIEMEKGGFTIVKMRPPTELHGFTIGQSKVRSRYGVTVFGLMSPGEPFEYATPDTLVSAEDVLVVGGDAALLERFANRA